MGLAFGSVNASKYGISTLQLVRPKRYHYHFKLDFDNVLRINLLLEQELFGSFSEFVRYAFMNQFQLGLNEVLRFNLLFTEECPLKRKISIKFPLGSATLLREFCEKNSFQYSQLLRYCVTEELRKWKV